MPTKGQLQRLLLPTQGKREKRANIPIPEELLLLLAQQLQSD